MSHNLTEHLIEQKEYLECGVEGPRNVANVEYVGAFKSLDYEEDFTIDNFKNKLQINIQEVSDETIVFDITPLNVAIANTLRRILISEIPTVAIETVHLWQNTGVIQDETLAHRLGLIPFRINPDTLKYRKENEELQESNSLKFSLHVKCQSSDIPPNETSLPIYASALKWIPYSEKQAQKYAKNLPVPVYPDILITKLKPDQEIEAELYCEKGIGQTHAKWSPVATAVYRLKPCIKFPKGPLSGKDAEEILKVCPKDVFDILNGESLTPDIKQCVACRACVERFPDKIKLLKKKDHIIFTIESAGSIAAIELFLRAIKVLKQKALNVKASLKNFTKNDIED